MNTPSRTIRVCDPAEYGGRILIECFDYFAGRCMWAVPAWDERGFAGLVGPFSCVQAAESAIEDIAEYLEAHGYRFDGVLTA